MSSNQRVHLPPTQVYNPPPAYGASEYPPAPQPNYYPQAAAPVPYGQSFVPPYGNGQVYGQSHVQEYQPGQGGYVQQPPQQQFVPQPYQQVVVAQPVVSNQYGQQGAGKFAYEASTYNDVGFAALFIGHLIAIVILACAYGGSFISKVNESNSSKINVATGANAMLIQILVVMAIFGGVFGVLWLYLLRKYPENMIKASIFGNMAVLFAVMVYCFAARNAGLGIWLAFMFIISLLFYYAAREYIPFSSVILSIGAGIIQDINGTLSVAIAVLVLKIAWIALWAFTVLSLYYYYDGINGFGYFLLLISLYWTSQVLVAISHTTSAGIACSWYFSPGKTELTGSSLRRACTTSFGSLCLGSLLVAIVQALRAMLRQARQRDGLACVADCLLGCLENIMQFINTYAYIYVAMYGTPFMQSASDAWSLMTSRGFDVIVNNDLTLTTVNMCSIMTGLIAGAIGGSWASGRNVSSSWWIYAILSFAVAAWMCSVVLRVVYSVVISLFVCLAEDPAQLANSRPNEYQRVKSAVAGIYGNQYDSVFI